MQFTVNGMAFSKEDLTTIGLADLRVHSISKSHLFMMLPNKCLCVLRAGEYIDEYFINKYQIKGVESFYALNVVDDDDYQKYKEYFYKFKMASDEQKRRIAIEEIMIAVAQDYWKKETQKSYLTLTVVLFDEFYNLPPDIIYAIQNVSLSHYSRILVSSTYACLIAMATGFNDYFFIKDIYNLCLMQDYSLVHHKASFLLYEACEVERLNPGDGLQYLEKARVSKLEIEIYKNHPVESSQIAFDFKEHFTNPELIYAIQFHHEKTDGSGFPHGLSYSAMSSWELIFTLADYLTPFREKIFKPHDGHDFLWQAVIDLKANEKRIAIPIYKLMAQFESKMQSAVNAKIMSLESMSRKDIKEAM